MILKYFFLSPEPALDFVISYAPSNAKYLINRA